ncbi:PPK2 family polyphosphate kinase [Plantactinospora sp. GCM10030261]|uniref:PPK2 family polyphosphate kinase n=1 Tax=Plantactinospora sp. GCM10030261 TaxID=3273420 RepID=UPI003614C6B0
MDEPEFSVRELLRARPRGPGAPVDLAAVDPRSTPGVPTGLDRAAAKRWAAERVGALAVDLAGLQEKLSASARADPAFTGRVLLVLQAMDAGGKDGTIRRVAGAMNPLGLHIRSFGPPTEEESRHDFLWRIRRALPRPGYVGVFNRSHYEDVLIARVESLVPEAVWRSRYDEINAFERGLVGEGFTLVKVFLHISPEEQLDRLTRRLDNPEKHWKYDPADVDARARWDDYRAAYADAITLCNDVNAPWYVVPADRKWYRDWAVASLLRETLAELGLAYPPANFDVNRERHRLAGAVRVGQRDRPATARGLR